MWSRSGSDHARERCGSGRAGPDWVYFWSMRLRSGIGCSSLGWRGIRGARWVGRVIEVAWLKSDVGIQVEEVEDWSVEVLFESTHVFLAQGTSFLRS